METRKVETLNNSSMVELVSEKNNVNDSIPKLKSRIEKPKKVYRDKKHYSDYDIVYLRVENHDDNDDNDGNIGDDAPIDQTDDGQNKTDTTTETKRLFRQQSKSESFITRLPPTGGGNLPPDNHRIRKTKSYIDITDTQIYKEIYVNNLRQYGFLLAKQLGISNESPDTLRKKYNMNRQKANDRREKDAELRTRTYSNIESPILQRRKSSSQSGSVTDLSDRRRKLSTLSNLTNSTGDLSNNRATSLTDISNIIHDHEVIKKPTTVIRRKKSNMPQDSRKRLSAPVLASEALVLEEYDGNRKLSLPSDDIISPRQRSTSVLSLNIPSLTYSTEDVTSQDKKKGERKASQGSLARQNKAKERLEYRMSRLKSFEVVLSQAHGFMKDILKKATSRENIALASNSPLLNNSDRVLHNTENDTIEGQPEDVNFSNINHIQQQNDKLININQVEHQNDKLNNDNNQVQPQNDELVSISQVELKNEELINSNQVEQ